MDKPDCPVLPLSNAINGDSEAPQESSKIASRSETSNLEVPEAFVLDSAVPINSESFPNKPRKGSTQVPTTISNVLYMLRQYGIQVSYDVIKKKFLITVPGLSGSPENAANVAMSYIVSLAILNGMSSGRIPEFVAAIGDRNQRNPVADWIESKPWDGIDRLLSLCNTLVLREGYPWQLKEVLIRRWLISAVAAVFEPSGFRARGVLTLQGPQSIGKTAWIMALVPDLILRENFVKVDHHLDAGQKDSIITAISHWIVEIGELDSSFKKDVARLKGFLTSDRDKMRRPYARTDSEYPRRTVFCATVNESQFLIDPTGNTRWWTIPVVRVNYEHGINMQQLFAQMTVSYRNGDKWWLTQAEESFLEDFNKQHRSFSVVRESILDEVDMERAQEPDLPAMTAIEVLRLAGFRNPTNQNCKECASILREHFGDSKRIKGRNVWRVPLKHQESMNTFTPRGRF